AVHTAKLKEIRIQTHYNEALQMAVVSVEDNGPGMEEDVRSRVFEPYFSTKQDGTGLGLAIAKRIVNDHDGFIRVESTPGKGTRFWIELPTALRRDFSGAESPETVLNKSSGKASRGAAK
ncbi:MAG: ATP-binding protein, partial [Bacteriovoracia bacterium]